MYLLETYTCIMPCYFIPSVSLWKFNIIICRLFWNFLQNSETPNKIDIKTHYVVHMDGLMGIRDRNTSICLRF